jgi:hypothetical protein
MVMVKKTSDSGSAPTLDILAAELQIVEATLTLEEQDISLDDGRSFTAEPNLNCRIRVLSNLVDPGVDEGVEFFDRFKLKKDNDGDWTFSKYSKLGNLIVVRYGEEWFDDDAAEFEEADFDGFRFVARVQPKTDPKGKALPGSVVDWKSMRKAGEAKAAKAEASTDESEDFEDIPF